MKLSVAVCGLALLAFPPAAVAETVPYVVVPPSDFQDGCQEGCACPVAVFPLRGTFLLTPLGPQDGFDVFAVTDVAWTIAAGATAGPEDRRVSGSGTFRIRREPDARQRLELDLAIDDGTPVFFDSGLVPVTATWPDIDVAIARNGFFCYDHVFSVGAQAEPAIGVEASTWGRVKGTYRP